VVAEDEHAPGLGGCEIGGSAQLILRPLHFDRFGNSSAQIERVLVSRNQLDRAVDVSQRR
jgi:hypothetical protein